MSIFQGWSASNAVKLMSLVIASSMACGAHAVGEDDILGTWRLIDLSAGAAKAKGKFYKEANGQYAFRITEVYKDNYRARNVIETCVSCPAGFANKPLKGMKIMWGFKAKDHDYLKGQGIDPWKRKIYTSNLHLNDRKNMLKVAKNYTAKSTTGFNFGKNYYLMRDK